MPVPEYQTFMAPALRALQDGQPRSIGEVRELVAAEMSITDEDREEVIRSGISVFDSRVGWAVTYMVQAGLIRRPKRAVNQITERGLQVLCDHPDRVDNHILSQFEEFREFKARTRTTTEQPAETADTAASTGLSVSKGAPRETIQAAIEENNAAVASDILARIRERNPAFLENLVLKVLTAMGYGGAAGSAERLGRSGDEGLDGVIKQDPLGLDRIYVQAKRYAADRTVGRPDIQGFVGALHGAQADRGVFITTSKFSQDAHEYADKVNARVILIDGAYLYRRRLSIESASRAQHRGPELRDLRSQAGR
jgi:restriction system protein